MDTCITELGDEVLAAAGRRYICTMALTSGPGRRPVRIPARSHDGQSCRRFRDRRGNGHQDDGPVDVSRVILAIQLQLFAAHLPRSRKRHLEVPHARW